MDGQLVLSPSFFEFGRSSGQPPSGVFLKRELSTIPDTTILKIVGNYFKTQFYFDLDNSSKLGRWCDLLEFLQGTLTLLKIEDIPWSWESLITAGRWLELIWTKVQRGDISRDVAPDLLAWTTEYEKARVKLNELNGRYFAVLRINTPSNMVPVVLSHHLAS